MDAAPGLRLSFRPDSFFINFQTYEQEDCDELRIESNDQYWAHCRNPQSFNFSVIVSEQNYISARANAADAFLTKAVEYLDAGHEVDQESFFDVVARCINGGYLNPERAEELKAHFTVAEG